MLTPGQSVTWEEHWYAVNGTGGFVYANDKAALNLQLITSTVEIAAASTTATSGRLVLYHDGRSVAIWTVALSPGQAFRDSFRPAGDIVGGQWEVVLFDTAGRRIAATSQTGTKGRIAP